MSISNRKHENPIANKVYQELADHYSMSLLPTRVLAPKDKATEISRSRKGGKNVPNLKVLNAGRQLTGGVDCSLLRVYWLSNRLSCGSHAHIG